MVASDRILDTFLDLVRIDSPVRSERQVAQYCAARLSEVGAAITFDDSMAITGSDTGNLIATLPGRGCEKVVILSAHMDCVDPCIGVTPVIEDGVVRSCGQTVLGADDKAGIAVIIEAVRALASSPEPHPGMKVVLTVAEENGLAGAKALSPQAFEGDVCLVLDAAGPPGQVVTGAPTHYTFDAVFAGKAAHAGISPEEGCSALVMAASSVCAMELGRIDASTTANIGVIEGGTATNVVPASARMTGECRSLLRDTVEQVRSSMDESMRTCAEKLGGSAEIKWTLEYEGFTVSDDSPYMAQVLDACRDAGIPPVKVTTGGGSDGSIFASRGVPTFVLACGMRDAHSTTEHIAIDDLRATLEIVLAFVRRLTRESM